MASNTGQVQHAKTAESNILQVFTTGAANFVKKHKAISGSYAFGMFLLLFATGFRVSDDVRMSYEDRITNAVDDEAKQKVFFEFKRAEEVYHMRKGWFSCDAHCTSAKRKMDDAGRHLDALNRAEAASISDAKAQVGILSEYGVQETRDVFWNAFSGGKSFAKRQSMWDMLFMGLRWGRDENIISVLLKWLIQLLFNFTLGLIGALVVFIFKLWGVISSYQADPATAVTYFLAASVSATACVITYLGFMYAAALGTVGVVGKALIDHNRRMEQDPNRRHARVPNQPHNFQRNPYRQQRPHFN